MANGRSHKRAREEEGSEPGELDLSASEDILALSDNDDPQPKERKKLKIEGSKNDTSVRFTAIRKLKSAPKGSIGIPAVRALLARSSSSSGKFMDAAKETNSGLRKNGRVGTVGAGTRKSSNSKGKASMAAKTGAPLPIKANKMKVAIIIFLHKGVVGVDDIDALGDEDEDSMSLDDEDSLRPEYLLVKPPSQLSADVIQRHKRYGLAVVNGTSGIDIDREATFWDVEEMLRKSFPALFDWFDSLPKIEANSADDFGDPEHLPQWLLCNKLPGRSSGVSVASGVAFPTGPNIDFNVQIKRSGFKENILILTTRAPVPTEILNKWQKRVGKKPAISTPYIPSFSANDSDSDFPEYIATLAKSPPLASDSLGYSASANTVAGPSTATRSRSVGHTLEAVKQPEAEIIEIADSPTPPLRNGRTASPTFATVEKLNASFSGSFYVDESLKALNPWEVSGAGESWDF